MRMRTLLLLTLLAAATAAAQSKKIVVMGMSEAQVEELRKTKPANVKIVRIENPRTSADVVAIVADSPDGSSRASKLMQETADADAIIGAPSREVLAAAKNLKWLQITSAGVFPYLHPKSSIAIS